MAGRPSLDWEFLGSSELYDGMWQHGASAPRPAPFFAYPWRCHVPQGALPSHRWTLWLTYPSSAQAAKTVVPDLWRELSRPWKQFLATCTVDSAKPKGGPVSSSLLPGRWSRSGCVSSGLLLDGGERSLPVPLSGFPDWNGDFWTTCEHNVLLLLLNHVSIQALPMGTSLVLLGPFCTAITLDGSKCIDDDPNLPITRLVSQISPTPVGMRWFLRYPQKMNFLRFARENEWFSLVWNYIP